MHCISALLRTYWSSPTCSVLHSFGPLYRLFSLFGNLPSRLISTPAEKFWINSNVMSLSKPLFTCQLRLADSSLHSSITTLSALYRCHLLDCELPKESNLTFFFSPRIVPKDNTQIKNIHIKFIKFKNCWINLLPEIKYISSYLDAFNTSRHCITQICPLVLSNFPTFLKPTPPKPIIPLGMCIVFLWLSESMLSRCADLLHLVQN